MAKIKTVFILFILLSRTSTLEYIFKCLHQSQRDLRASSFCNRTLVSWYSCLYDVQTGTYVEDCSLKPDYVRRGEKYVISGRRANEPCSSQRYQPFRFWSNTSVDCIFDKSACNEVGQMTFHNGTIEQDATCRCDHRKSYAFLSRTKNLCFCSPSEEDCTCFQKLCPKGKQLNSDYECSNESTHGDSYCKFTDAYFEDSNFTMPYETISLKGNRRGNVHVFTALVLVSCMSVVVIIFVSHKYIKGNNSCTAVCIKDKQLVNWQTVYLFSQTIPRHWRSLNKIIDSESILTSLMNQKFISREECETNTRTTYKNTYVLVYLSTKYMERTAGKFNGATFRKLLNRQPEEVKKILSEEVNITRLPKRDPVKCKSQLEEATDPVDQIQFEECMGELIERLIFSVNEYNNITKESAGTRNETVLRLLIKYLHKGSFECFFKHLKTSAEKSLYDITAISLTRVYYSDEWILDADTKICQAKLSLYIPENSKFNGKIAIDIRDYTQWFILEFGMYPTTAWDLEDNSNNVITLQTLCPDSSHRIKESFEKDGFTELLERLICRTKVMETLTNEEDKLDVEMILVYNKGNNTEYTFEDTPDFIDDVEILKANTTYLVNEMETADITEIFNGDQDFENFNQSAEKIIKNQYILDTILRNPSKYLKRFKHQIEKKDTCQNIRKRLEESRYVYGKKIDTETLRGNIIENVINLRDLSFDTDEFQSKYEDRNILTKEEFKRFGSKDPDVLLIVETLKSGRKAMLTFVDCLFQGAYLGMAETLLVERKTTLNRDRENHYRRLKTGDKNNTENILKANFSIHKE